MTVALACQCLSSCYCWTRPDQLNLGCGCTAEHQPPQGCRYDEQDIAGWKQRWPGVDGAVMVCLTHGGLAPGDAYLDPACTDPCRDSHLTPKRRKELSGRRIRTV